MSENNIQKEFQEARLDSIAEKIGKDFPSVLDHTQGIVSAYALIYDIEDVAIKRLTNNIEQYFSELIPDFITNKRDYQSTLSTYRNNVKNELKYSKVGVLPLAIAVTNPIVISAMVGLAALTAHKIGVFSTNKSFLSSIKDKLSQWRQRMKRDYRPPKGTKPPSPLGEVIKPIAYATAITSIALSQSGQDLISGISKTPESLVSIAKYAIVGLGLFLLYTVVK